MHCVQGGYKNYNWLVFNWNIIENIQFIDPAILRNHIGAEFTTISGALKIYATPSKKWIE